ncbi:hypothetical protein MB27_25700 [Actinoplanes utahensis]|uniref:Uncharacterized protein n=1 Tax=Actinoplanes utahensis TaxID=1869 RepID=A0A0A6UG32_ACTUT|nr:hypothetical protein MB27_25700 [Actinoplanes utahensis]
MLVEHDHRTWLQRFCDLIGRRLNLELLSDVRTHQLDVAVNNEILSDTNVSVKEASRPGYAFPVHAWPTRGVGAHDPGVVV